MQALRYLDFDLKIERAAEGYTARVLESPAGEASAGFTVPFNNDRLELLLMKVGGAVVTDRTTRGISAVEQDAARELGGKLFEAVLGHDVRACLRSSLSQAEMQENTGLRIKLRLQDVPELADLPWEFLFDASMNRFLAQSNQTPIVRYVEMPGRVQPLTVGLPLNVLVMVSSPDDPAFAKLDVEREKAQIVDALKPLMDHGQMRITWLEEASLAALQRELRTGQYHVFHFVGHGGFDPKAEEGVLVLEDERSRGVLVDAHRIGTILHDHRWLRLALLNSCKGARNSRTDPFAGVAAGLIQQGVPAVVGMQFEITDEAAIIFSKEFYTALAEGHPVDASVAEARKAVYAQPNDLEWATPVLYTRAPDGVLFDLTSGTTALPKPPPEAPPKPSPPPPPSKDPVVAAVISFFLPGIGQVYLGQGTKGWSLFGAWAVLTVMFLGTVESGDSISFFFIVTGIWLLAWIDAYKIANKLRRGETVTPGQFFWT